MGEPPGQSDAAAEIATSLSGQSCPPRLLNGQVAMSTPGSDWPEGRRRRKEAVPCLLYLCRQYDASSNDDIEYVSGHLRHDDDPHSKAQEGT